MKKDNDMIKKFYAAMTLTIIKAFLFLEIKFLHTLRGYFEVNQQNDNGAGSDWFGWIYNGDQ